MIHDILVKRKSVLDQFRKGLSTLGFLADMEHNPSLFEEFFVHQGVLSNDFVISCLHFQESRDLETSGDRVYQMLQTFLRNLCLDALKNFLKFVTGTYMKFPCLTCHIVFQYLAIYSVDSIFASTSLLELKLPNHFPNYTAFDLAMRTVLRFLIQNSSILD